jgi:CubicO group peptidase (beta-lactamase class C family)
MTAERWQQIREVLEKVLELAPEPAALLLPLPDETDRVQCGFASSVGGFLRAAQILPLAVVSIVCATGSFAQNSTPASPLDPERLKSIDSFIATEMARQKIPGLAVGIYRRGQILLAKGYGQANVELGVPVKPQTIFQSGSVGKQFVSAAIMMLVEKGKLSFDDNITKYFSEAPMWHTSVTPDSSTQA